MRTLWICLAGLGLLWTSAARAEDAAAVRSRFAKPGREYATAPLWVWNDMLTEEQVVGTLEDLARQGVKQAFVHPRPGLMTPYLSDDWFRLWKAALAAAERLDMNVWIYDENSYPSGFAGGLVPEAMPESRGRGIHAQEVKRPEKLDASVAAVFRLNGDVYEDVTAKARAGETLDEAQYLVFTWREAPPGGWFGGKWYVDLLKPGVTEKFLEITMGAYEREIGEAFGKRCPGVFTDEPHLAPAGGLHWNEHLTEELQKRWGYNLLDHLPSLVRQIGDWRRVRHNYQQLLLEQFIEHWAKPFHDYCEAHNLEFTGHYWEHGWPGASHGPDNMAMYAWHQRPAIDCLMNQYDEGVHAQFGNARFVRELASAARQLGRTRTLCEAYGAGGWDLRFEDMKRIGDWLYVLGVNTMDEHLSYITIRGARKRDHPQSFSYHEPWWEDYHVMAQYFARLSAALSAGELMTGSVAVIEPTTTAWIYQNDPSQREKLEGLGNGFQDLVNKLEAAQAEYDLVSEDILARFAKADYPRTGGHPPSRLILPGCTYKTIVLPPGTENLNAKTYKLLTAYPFMKVLYCDALPTLIDGELSDILPVVAAKAWTKVDATALVEEIRKRHEPGLTINRAENDGDKLFHQRRRLDDGQLLFLVNTSIDAPSAGTLKVAGKSIEAWDLWTGSTTAYPTKSADKALTAEFNLPPCGSLLLFISNKAEPGTRAAAPADAKAITPTGPLEISRLDGNVLTIDHVDITTGGQTREGIYFYEANRMAFAAAGMERNPWDSAVQLRDQLITKTFPAESGFEVTYRFTLEGDVPRELAIVIERPDLYTISVNGKPAKAVAGQWWLDKVFGKIDLAGLAKPGENAVTLKAQPFTIYHEIEPAYLLGDFNLRPVEKGFVVTAPQPLKLGPWNEQGHPFYAAGVRYSQAFDVVQPRGTYQVSVPAWYGSVARVTVNGQPAARLVARPWECDVTGLIRPGRNTVEVTVIGTLKNTLGPHHGDVRLGSAWPAAFQHAPPGGLPPGGKYHTVGYGLMEPFVLREAAQ